MSLSATALQPELRSTPVQQVRNRDKATADNRNESNNLPLMQVSSPQQHTYQKMPAADLSKAPRPLSQQVPKLQNPEKATAHTETSPQYQKQGRQPQGQGYQNLMEAQPKHASEKRPDKAVSAKNSNADQTVADRLTQKPEVISEREIPDAIYTESRKSLATASTVSLFRSPDSVQRATDVIHQARYRRRIPPDYPRRAFELGQQGMVTLHAEVLPSGFPDELKVAKSSGYRLLDVAALAAVRKWEFEPTTINGSAVTSWVRVPVHFVIENY